MRALMDWIEDRTGLISTVEHFMNEEIPASSGWHQVFGSARRHYKKHYGYREIIGIPTSPVILNKRESS